MNKELRSELVKGARFSLIALLVVLAFYYVPYDYLPWSSLEKLALNSTLSLLALTGFQAIAFESAEGFFIAHGSTLGQIIELCTGYLEFIVLAAFILASEDRSLKKRVDGVLMGAAFVLLLNPLRIGVTFQSLALQGIEAADFLHSSLFRASLFAVVFGFYAWWYLKYSIKSKD